MKSFPPWITLSLTAGAAFAAAYFMAHRPTENSVGRPGTAALIAKAAATREAAAAAAAPGPAAPGVLLDTRLREALAMTDLAAAIKHIMAHQEEDHCADTRLVCLIEQLPASRLAELPAALAAHMGNDYVVRFVLGAWAQRDAAGALAWVESTPALHAAGTRAFLTGWMRGAPEAALAWLDARPLSTSSDNLRTAVVEAMAETNPAAALAMMKSRGWLANSPNALVKLLQNWGGVDPQAALGALRALHQELGLTWAADGDTQPAGSARNDQTFTILLRALLLGAYERNPTDAAALFAAFQPDELFAGSHAFAQEVLARDPAAGAALFTAHPDNITRTLLNEVAEQNPSLALSCLGRIADADLRQQIVRSATSGYDRGMAALVPPESQAVVSEALAGMEPGRRRDQAAARICEANAASAPQWAAELWRSLPAEQRQECSPGFFRGVASSSPDLALTEYRNSRPEVQAAALRILSHSLAASRPAETLQLVLESTPVENRAVSAATLFSFWAESDQPAALAALDRHAARLNLPALEIQLENAGLLPSPHGFTPHHVNTAPIAAKIQELRAAHPSPAQ